MGPLLIFDKSLLHHLNPEEIDELSRSFMLVSTPTLVREIIADLQQHKPVDFIPEEMVMALARKMSAAHATHPANFRKLVLFNLACTKVPLEGQVPIDGSRPNVATMDGGFLYDHTPEQAVWERWANGDFDNKGLWRLSVLAQASTVLALASEAWNRSSSFTDEFAATVRASSRRSKT